MKRRIGQSILLPDQEPIALDGEHARGMSLRQQLEAANVLSR